MQIEYPIGMLACGPTHSLFIIFDAMNAIEPQWPWRQIWMEQLESQLHQSCVPLGDGKAGINKVGMELKNVKISKIDVRTIPETQNNRSWPLVRTLVNQSTRHEPLRRTPRSEPVEFWAYRARVCQRGDGIGERPIIEL